MFCKIDLEIVSTSRNKRKTEEVDNQVNEVISDFVDKAEESLPQKTQHKKRYTRYSTQESGKQRNVENHALLSGCSSNC